MSRSYPNGLTLVHNAVTEQEAKDLVALVDSRPWQDSLQRRTQHYGVRYDYKRKHLDPAEPVPELIAAVGARIMRVEATDVAVIVNEYMPGQGISQHIDDPHLFGPKVVSVSLLHAVPMVFRPKSYLIGDPIEIMLPVRSAAIMEGDARYTWSHEIAARKKDGRVPRDRRISITFRTIK